MPMSATRDIEILCEYTSKLIVVPRAAERPVSILFKNREHFELYKTSCQSSNDQTIFYN